MTVLKASEFRQHAEQCRTMARATGPGELREQLLMMAQTWEKLAADRAALIARHPETALPDEAREEAATEAWWNFVRSKVLTHLAQA